VAHATHALARGHTTWRAGAFVPHADAET